MCRFKLLLFIKLHTCCRFQYILCVGSSLKIHNHRPKSKPVSIHPMCRFKHPPLSITPAPSTVSIHPMCRFKFLYLFTYKPINMVSIHPMCRFKLCTFGKSLRGLTVSIHPMCRFKHIYKAPYYHL